MQKPSIRDIAEGVRQFNVTFGEMERALWRLSTAARAELLEGRNSPILEGLLWTIKSWWGVQGAPSETKRIMAQALTREQWSRELFENGSGLGPADERFACDRVARLVSSSLELGARRNEVSLASKVLHWLMPSRVPVYDSFVRTGIGVPATKSALDAYRRVVAWEFDVARHFTSEASAWVGEIEPRSPFRALDKYMWWISGGNSGRAVIVKDPWRIVRELGLSS